MTKPELDSFDRALLTELRQVAAETATAPAAPTAESRRIRKRWAYAGTGVAAAAVTAFGLSSTLGSPSAYAVDEQGDGDIVITIRELDDADGLEQALADHGIEADVDYQADGGWQVLGVDPPPGGAELNESDSFKAGVEVGTEEVGPEVEPDHAVAGEPPDGPCGGFDEMPFDTDLTKEDYVITIPADSVLQESDAVLRITTSGDLDDQVAGLDVAYSIGDADCGFGTMTLNAR